MSGRRYKIQSVLGQGGFGTVYRARLLGAEGFSKPVALKVLNPEMAASAEFARRLRDEARVLGLVQHRAIVKVDTLVPLEGRWTIVMEYVEGPDLRRVLESTGRLPVGATLEVGAEVAAALYAAWNVTGPDGDPLHLLHRDIKPANLCVTRLGEVKILDFGIARANFGDREARTQSQAFGTPEYMAPERFLFENGPAADVYALGASLYELLSGERLGRASPNEGAHEALMSARMQSLRQLLGDAHEDVVDLLVAMTAYTPAARPSARDAERRLIRLRHQRSDALLRDWAEIVISPRVDADEARTDSATGTELVEGDPVESPSLLGSRWPDAPQPRAETSTFAFGATPGNPTLVADSREILRRRRPVWLAPVLLLVGLGAAAGIWTMRIPPGGPVEEPVVQPASPLVTVETVPPAPPPVAPEPVETETVAPPQPTSAPKQTARAPATTPTTPPATLPTTTTPVEAASDPGPTDTTGVGGRWEGTFGGRSFDLSLSGAASALRGRFTVHFEGNKVANAVTGRFDASTGKLSLVDADAVDDAGRYEIGVENGQLNGYFQSNDGGTRLLLVGWRAK